MLEALNKAQVNFKTLYSGKVNAEELRPSKHLCTSSRSQLSLQLVRGHVTAPTNVLELK